VIGGPGSRRDPPFTLAALLAAPMTVPCRDGAAHCSCFATEHEPRRAGDGECCRCGAMNGAYAPPQREDDNRE
jgi:hypothetical protein